MKQMNITKVTIVRHGETEWNRLGKHQGQLDSPLTQVGINQAKAVAVNLKGEPFDFILSSDLMRARHTAEIIAQELHLEVRLDPRLRERQLGVAQGLTRAELSERYPEVYQKYFSDLDFKIPGGESVRECDCRVGAWMSALALEYPEHRLLVVTHGLILSYILKRVLGLPLASHRKFSLFNASINRFSIRDGEWFLDSWGELAKNLGHLDELRLDE